MSKLINFFFSFDKLMKEGLVRAFFWLGLINIALVFFAEMLDAIKLDWFAALFEFVQFFAGFLLAVVALRLLAELAIAIFRMNDNLSPDGGKSETADIDPVMEARHAAELAAKRAQEATKSAVDRTSAATKSATERSKSAAHDLKEDLSSKVRPQVAPVKKSSKAITAKAKSGSADKVKTVDVKPTSVKKAAPKKVAPKKAATKTSVSKASAAKKTPTKKASAKSKTKISNIKRQAGLKLDGTPRKKPGPKPKS